MKYLFSPKGTMEWRPMSEEQLQTRLYPYQIEFVNNGNTLATDKGHYKKNTEK